MAGRSSQGSLSKLATANGDVHRPRKFLSMRLKHMDHTNCWECVQGCKVCQRSQAIKYCVWQTCYPEHDALRRDSGAHMCTGA